jgi:hypothetical protein
MSSRAAPLRQWSGIQFLSGERMDVTTFRRYLQPSPTLRWHPWAPLATLVLALVFVFGAGIALGVKYEERRLRVSLYTPGLMEMNLQAEVKVRPTAAVIRRAQTIDNSVAQWVHDYEHKTWLDGVMDAIEPHLRAERVSRIKSDDALRDAMRRVAEWRLANLAVGAPAWEQTAAYCEEWKSAFNVTDIYERYAKAYTTLLGREISAKKLAPAVPGGKCNERSTR